MTLRPISRTGFPAESTKGCVEVEWSAPDGAGGGGAVVVGGNVVVVGGDVVVVVGAAVVVVVVIGVVSTTSWGLLVPSRLVKPCHLLSEVTSAMLTRPGP